MGRRNEHTQEQQREMALAAAELLVVRKGMAGFSMRKVASAIGYTVGNLYLLFESQDDLLSLINERTADAIYAFLRDSCEPQRGPRARLCAMGTAYIEFAQRHPHRWRLLFEHQLPAKMLPRPSVDVRLKRLFDLVEENLRELLPGARPERLHAAATALWSSVHGVCSLAVTGKLKWSGLHDYRPLSELVVETFLDGLRGESRPPPRRRKVH